MTHFDQIACLSHDIPYFDQIACLVSCHDSFQPDVLSYVKTHFDQIACLLSYVLTHFNQMSCLIVMSRLISTRLLVLSHDSFRPDCLSCLMAHFDQITCLLSYVMTHFHQILDARNPLLFRSLDLEKYVKEVSALKKNLILLNKVP